MNELIELLESLSYPTYLQGSLPEEEPASFFTVWDFTTEDASHYDNDAKTNEIGYWVYFYSVNPEQCEEMLKKARTLLKDNDYIVEGPPRSAMAHRQEYSGKFITIYKINNY